MKISQKTIKTQLPTPGLTRKQIITREIDQTIVILTRCILKKTTSEIIDNEVKVLSSLNDTPDARAQAVTRLKSIRDKKKNTKRRRSIAIIITLMRLITKPIIREIECNNLDFNKTMLTTLITIIVIKYFNNEI